MWKNLTDLNPIQHLWDKLERQLRARPYHSTSVLDLTNALVAEWEQIPAARLQNLVDSLKPEGFGLVFWVRAFLFINAKYGRSIAKIAAKPDSSLSTASKESRCKKISGTNRGKETKARSISHFPRGLTSDSVELFPSTCHPQI